ncbi:flavodoxin family protein [Hyphococcus sp.]|uniref:flavodoxin family protein n=1 Tax=Hyphococcus sp. TaxID=2038636 RepID=UPI003CCBBA4F
MTGHAQILGVLGTSRPGGATATLARAVFSHFDNAALIDLSTLTIGPYSYTHAFRDDDFHALALRMGAAGAIIFASPVYWYCMSAQMKTVFDRLTDLTGVYKPIGKSLASKAMFVVATGGAPAPPESFTRPFADTAGYFNMRWGGFLYAPGQAVSAPETRRAAQAFARNIVAALPGPAGT